MLKSYIKQIEEIGPVLFERSKMAKHLNISVRFFIGVRVAVPYGLSFKKAEKIVHTKKNWIKRCLAKIKQVEKKNKSVLKNSANIGISTARKKLIHRLKELSKKHGFTYNKIFIRNQKTRWGSCSTKNNINLNRKLIDLPDELIKYVILHELVHTRIKSHSRAFWNELDRVAGDAKKLQSRLKEYGLGFL